MGAKEKQMGNESQYRTAIVAQHVFTLNGEKDLRRGQVVGVRYLRHDFHKLLRRDVAVYMVSTATGGEWGELYAPALSRFE